MDDKWYKGLVNNKEDSLVPLLNLLVNEESFFDHFISNTIFFRKEDIVRQQ